MTRKLLTSAGIEKNHDRRSHYNKEYKEAFRKYAKDGHRHGQPLENKFDYQISPVGKNRKGA